MATTSLAAAIRLPPPPPPPHLHHHRLSRQRGIKWVPISMARLSVTIMVGRSLCLAMVCAWRLELRSMTPAVQDTSDMDTFECINGYRPLGSSLVLTSMVMPATRLDLRCLCPKTGRESPSGRPRSGLGKGKVRVYRMRSSVDGPSSAMILRERQLKTCSVHTVALSGSGTRLAVGAPNNDPTGLT